MKRRISRRTMRRRKIMSFLRKIQCGRGRFGDFDRVIHDIKTGKHIKPQTGRGRLEDVNQKLRDLKKGKYTKPQTGRGIFSNMAGDYAFRQRMKYRI